MLINYIVHREICLFSAGGICKCIFVFMHVHMCIYAHEPC